MAFSQATLIRRVRSILNDNPYQDACTEAMDTTEVGLDVALLEKYDVGAVVEFQDDGELCLVTAVSAASGAGTLTVIRNYQFSVTVTAGTGTTHSTGAAIVRDPVFRYAQIVDSVDSTLRSLWPYVYKEVALTLTPTTDGNHWYNVTNGDTTGHIMEFSTVNQIVGSGATSRIFQYGVNGDAFNVQLFENLPTGKVASGQGIYLPHIKDRTTSVFVVGIGRITAVTSGGNYSDITEGIEVDCVTYFAVARLVAQTDISRSTQEDTTMSDQSVTPGRRTEIALYWENKAVERRKQWQQELDIRLPRMVYRRGGYRRRFGS